MQSSNLEIRFHGRGGEGAKSAAQLIAEAALLEGKFVQAFPEYGPERSGAPVASFVRISDEEITTHQPVVVPDFIGVINNGMILFPEIVEGIKPSSILVVNSSLSDEELKKKLKINAKIYSINASEIAKRHLGMNKANTAIVAAIAYLSKAATLNSIIEVTYNLFKRKSEEIAEANVAIVKEVWNLFETKK